MSLSYATVSALLLPAMLLDNTSFTDEAWFQLSGCVNSHSDRLWSSEIHMYIMKVDCMRCKSAFGARSYDARLSVQYSFRTLTAERFEDILMQFVAFLEVNERNA